MDADPAAARDFPSIQERLYLQAEQTLRNYTNSKVKELNLATRAYKYDFPYDHSYNIRESNYRFFILLEKALFKKIPYLGSPSCKFWNKSKSTITLLLIPTPKEDRYIRKIRRILARIDPSDPPGRSISVSSTDVFLESSHTYARAVRILIDLNSSIWGTWGIAKLLYYYNDVERIFINLHKLGFYEPTEEAQPTPDSGIRIPAATDR